MKEHLTKWEQETDRLANLFVRHYFDREADTYWVADEIGGVLYVNDHFFDLNDIVDFIRYRYSKKKMFEYYDYALKMHEDKKTLINIKNYRHFK